jgi:hypothetical protein
MGRLARARRDKQEHRGRGGDDDCENRGETSAADAPTRFDRHGGGDVTTAACRDTVTTCRAGVEHAAHARRLWRRLPGRGSEDVAARQRNRVGTEVVAWLEHGLCS